MWTGGEEREGERWEGMGVGGGEGGTEDEEGNLAHAVLPTCELCKYNQYIHLDVNVMVLRLRRM